VQPAWHRARKWKSTVTNTGVIYIISIWLPPVRIAIALYEAAHGYFVCSLGDDMALRFGRVSHNPFRHIETFAE
jgi:hypothetical protein